MSSSTGFGSGTFGTSALGTSPFFNCKELIDSVLSFTGHSSPASETTKRAALTQAMNNCYQEVILGREWPWMKASYDFRLSEPYTTGTATATKGSTTVTGTGTVWNANLTPGNIFHFENSRVIYHIASVESDTELTLETAYSEDDQTDGGYVAVKNQYKVPKETDYLLTWVMNSDYKAIPVSPDELRLIQSKDPTRLGCPKFYSLVRRDTDDDATYVEVWPSPDKTYQTHIDYKVRILKLSDDEDEYPIIPDRYRAVLYHGMLWQFYQYLRKPESAAIQEKIYYRFLNRMENDFKFTDGQMKIIPARNYLRRRGRRGGYPLSYTVEDLSLAGDDL